MILINQVDPQCAFHCTVSAVHWQDIGLVCKFQAVLLPLEYLSQYLIKIMDLICRPGKKRCSGVNFDEEGCIAE